MTAQKMTDAQILEGNLPGHLFSTEAYSDIENRHLETLNTTNLEKLDQPAISFCDCNDAIVISNDHLQYILFTFNLFREVFLDSFQFFLLIIFGFSYIYVFFFCLGLTLSSLSLNFCRLYCPNVHYLCLIGSL